MQVLEVDSVKRRISLGLKQTMRNPWEVFVEGHPTGSTVEGEVKNTTEFGLFIGLDNDIDGMVHLSDIDWNVPGEEAMARYKKGETVKARVLDVDVEKERISLGIKQLSGDPMAGDLYRKGQIVTATVTEVTSMTVVVTVWPLRNTSPLNGSPDSCLMPRLMRSFSTSTSSTRALTVSPFG